jgi:hypothetical protein
MTGFWNIKCHTKYLGLAERFEYELRVSFRFRLGENWLKLKLPLAIQQFSRHIGVLR